MIYIYIYIHHIVIINIAVFVAPWGGAQPGRHAASPPAGQQKKHWDNNLPLYYPPLWILPNIELLWVRGRGDLETVQHWHMHKREP